jgi:hypothetical protein
MRMAPIPVILPLTIAGAIPINVIMMMLLPVDAPSTIFMFVEVVIVLVVFVVDVVAIVLMIVMIASVISILRKQIG